jgi:hypothetical protein
MPESCPHRFYRSSSYTRSPLRLALSLHSLTQRQESSARRARLKPVVWGFHSHTSRIVWGTGPYLFGVSACLSLRIDISPSTESQNFLCSVILQINLQLLVCASFVLTIQPEHATYRKHRLPKFSHYCESIFFRSLPAVFSLGFTTLASDYYDTILTLIECKGI